MIDPSVKFGTTSSIAPASIGVFGNEGSWYVAALSTAAERRGIRCVRLDYRQLVSRAGALGNYWEASGERLADLQAIIIRTMPPGSLEQVVFRMNALAQVEAVGVTMLNPPRAIECAVDKHLTTTRLALAGLRVPRTVVCETADLGMAACEELGGDVVIKPIFGSEGRGIVRVDSPDLAVRVLRTLERINAVLYLQEFINHPGYDVRVLVFHGYVLGGIKRFACDDFRTNIALRGTAKIHDVTDQEAHAALTAAAATGVVFAGVDLMYDRSDQLYVIEVNAVPGWQAFQATTGIDVAEKVMATVVPK